MRFATSPNAQPKSSGPSGPFGQPPAGALGPGFGTLKGVALVNGLLPQLHHAQFANTTLGGGVNGGANSGSQSSGSLGGGHHQLGQQQRHNQHQHQHLHQDDDDDDEEQGVLSSDELPGSSGYRLSTTSASRYSSGGNNNTSSHHHHHHHHSKHSHRLRNRHSVNGGHQNEGFRDSNELTVGPDQTMLSHQQQQLLRHSRNLYSSSSVVGPSASGAISGASSSALNSKSDSDLRHHHNHNQHHQHHHHGHNHRSTGPGSRSSGSQHQRLVHSSSNTSSPSASTRSTPQSDDQQSLDRLAYGNNWADSHGQTNGSNQQDSSNHSAGSGASILASSSNAKARRY